MRCRCVYGLLTALAFGLWPLGRVHDVPVAALFREAVTSEWHRPRWRYLALMAVVIALLIAVVIGLAYDKRVAAVFVASSVVVFALLRGIAGALMALARRLPRTAFTMLRLAIANIHRPGALTPSVVLSLGLGLAVLVTITQIDGNLRRQFLAALPERAPSFYFIDIPSAEADRFAHSCKQTAPQSTVEDVPMLRGRIVAARGVKAEDLEPVDRRRMGAAERPRPDLYRRNPEGLEGGRRRMVGAGLRRPAAGLDRKEDRRRARPQDRRPDRRQRARPRYHGDDRQHAQRRLAKPRHQFRAGVLAQRLQGRAAHPYRDLDREGTRTPPSDARIIKAVADAFPMVTSVRVREVLETIGSVVTNLVLAIRGASAVTLISAILVLGGALAAGHRHRVYDAVILKTLGATRARLLGAYALEYLMIGLATAVFGVIAGSIAAWLIVTRLMTLSFVWQAGSAAAVVASALVVTVGLGLAGTLLALNQKPATVLRNL